MKNRRFYKPTTFIKLFSLWPTIILTLIGCQTLTYTPTSTIMPTVTHTTPPPTLTEHATTPTPLPINTMVITSTPEINSALTPTPFSTAASSPHNIPAYPTLSVTEEVTFELVNQWGGQIESVAIQNNIAYLGVGMRLITLNVADPAAPELLGQSQAFSGLVRAVLVRDHIAYLGMGASVITLDVSNPQLPKLLGELTLPGPVTHLALDEGILIAAISFSPSDLYENGAGLLTTVRIQQPDQLQRLDTVTLPWTVNAMTFANKTVYVSNPADDIFYAVNVIDPTKLPLPAAFPGIPLSYSLQVQDQILFIGGGLSNVSAWNINLPLEPQKLWEIQAKPDPNLGLGVVKGFVFMDNNAYLGAVSYHGQKMAPLALEIPEPIANIQDNIVSSSIAYHKGYVYFANGDLSIYDAIDENMLPIGSFTQPEIWDIATIGNAGVFVDGNRQQTDNGNVLYTVRLPDLSLSGQYTDERRCRQCYSSFIELTVSDSTAYIGAVDDGLRLISLADLGSPTLLSSLDITNGFGDLRVTDTAVNNQQIFATNGACNGRNLTIYDIIDPHTPRLTSGIELDGCIGKVAVYNNILYAAATYADREGGALYLVDISIDEPGQSGAISLSESVHDVQIWDNLAVVTTSAGITAISIDESAHPQIIGEFSIPGGAYEIVISDGLAFVTTLDDGSNGLLAFDLSVPSAPRLVGIFNLPAKGEISLSGNLLLVGNPAMGLVTLKIEK